MVIRRLLCLFVENAEAWPTKQIRKIQTGSELP